MGEPTSERLIPPEINGKPIRLLIVEDDQTLSRIHERTLRSLGISDIETAETFPEAVKKLEQSKDDKAFNWAWLDFDIPGGSGADVMRKIHKEFPSTVFTLFTGRDPEDHNLSKLREEGLEFSTVQKGAKITPKTYEDQISRARQAIDRPIVNIE